MDAVAGLVQVDPDHAHGIVRARLDQNLPVEIPIAELVGIVEVIGIAGDAVDLDRAGRGRVVAAADRGGIIGQKSPIRGEGPDRALGLVDVDVVDIGGQRRVVHRRDQQLLSDACEVGAGVHRPQQPFRDVETFGQSLHHIGVAHVLGLALLGKVGRDGPQIGAGHVLLRDLVGGGHGARAARAKAGHDLRVQFPVHRQAVGLLEGGDGLLHVRSGQAVDSPRRKARALQKDLRADQGGVRLLRRGRLAGGIPRLRGRWRISGVFDGIARQGTGFAGHRLFRRRGRRWAAGGEPGPGQGDSGGGKEGQAADHDDS